MKLDFNRMWRLHPANNGIISPCSTDGVPNFDNQCAIRMSECLAEVGVSLKEFEGARCYPGHNHNQLHILRAEELAKWMKQNIQTFGKVNVKRGATSTDYKDKTGIVFLLNFWGVGNQGDHIDLWNGFKMTRGSTEYFTAAKEVWFWEIS